uniref:Uncharacterized protein n=1 Tax=Lepeophtheirus salmonis TaxID=72036 RepID=A0A0K2UTG9_LEPSM
MYFNLRYQKVRYHGVITLTVDGNVLAGSVFERAVRVLPDDGTSQQVAVPSNFSIILQIVDSGGRLCGP